MPAAEYDLIAEQGATFQRTLTWKDDDDSLIDLTGYTARMQVRPNVNSSSLVLDLTTENGRITLGGVAGTIDLVVAADVMATLNPQIAVYDLELISGIEVTRIIEGEFIINPEVTR